MAYPEVSRGYGAVPVNRNDGMPYAGAVTLIPIASTYNSPIYNGTPVTLASGFAEAATGDGVIGVCVGVQYVNELGQFTPAQYYPGNSVTDAFAMVVTDPAVGFKIAALNGYSEPINLTRAAIGSNASMIFESQGDPTTGNSIMALAGTTGSPKPFKIVGVVEDTRITPTTYREAIVSLNDPLYK